MTHTQHQTRKTKIVLASGNRGKLAELQALLDGLGVEVLSQSVFGVPKADETAATFVENALIKAGNAAEHSGLPAVADDSGLCVDALKGAPGVRSARYAGTDGDDTANNMRLLAELEGIPEQGRTAHFHSTVVYCRHAGDPAPLVAQGDWHGRILDAPRGAGGFGYDPLFWVDTEGASSAQLDRQRKNTLSHRGQAVRSLAARLRRDGLD